MRFAMPKIPFCRVIISIKMIGGMEPAYMNKMAVFIQ